jgi:hypothetical protein
LRLIGRERQRETERERGECTDLFSPLVGWFLGDRRSIEGFVAPLSLGAEKIVYFLSSEPLN